MGLKSVLVQDIIVYHSVCLSVHVLFIYNYEL